MPPETKDSGKDPLWTVTMGVSGMQMICPFYWKLDETGISSESSMVSVISGLEARLPKQDPPKTSKTLSKYQHQHLT